MSIIAIIILAVLAVAVLVGASKRRDRSAAGLSKEARRNDKPNPALVDADTGPTGREVEAAAAAARLRLKNQSWQHG